MLACLDVAYDDTHAHAGCLVFRDWSDGRAVVEHLRTTPLAAPYTPGQFFERELPPMLDLLAHVQSSGPPAPNGPRALWGREAPIATIVVDGYVWLAGKGMGLGAHLYEALGRKVPIVGVAKSEWTRAADPGEDPTHRAIHVTRGGSARPLFVTAAGIDVDVAAAHVATMHGAHRLPTLLKAVDSLVRAAAARAVRAP